MSVRLQRQQPSSDPTPRRDFLALQDNIQRALDQLQAQKIGRSDISNQAIGGDQVQPGIVSEDHLEPFLLSACKYRVASDQSIGSDAPISFATKVYDGEGVIVGSEFSPVKSGVYRLNAVLRIEDDGTGGVQHGQNARVVFYDETASSPVLLGPERPCITDIKGDVINAEIDETFEAIAGHKYSLRYEMPYPFSTGTGTPIHHIGYHTGTVKPAQVFATNSGDSINIESSFVEFEPIAQPE